MSSSVGIVRKVQTALSGLVIGAIVGIHPSFAIDMTAGAILKDMPVAERTAYITGVIDGLAYARFRKDTLTAGSKDERGMNCIYGWFHKDSLATLLRIEATFKKYYDEVPLVLLSLMVKKECGE